jgi:hypothetical protein
VSGVAVLIGVVGWGAEAGQREGVVAVYHQTASPATAQLRS